METGPTPSPSLPSELASVSEALRKYWGFDSFRPLQAPAMRSVLADRDSVVVLPTGGGKSLCFQAPAVCRSGLAVVVSPLISLMKDQVDALTSCGIPAACVNSSLSTEERRSVADRVRSGELRLLYMAPERLVTERTIDFLKAADVSFFAIDEAHCISEWGHDFRPEYRQLKMLKETFPGVAVHAYTATATDRVRQDIAKNLGLKEPEILVGSFDRPNLIYQVRQRDDVIHQIIEVLDRHPGDSGIIYCIRRNDVDMTAAALTQLGYHALPYHAGMSPLDRKRNQDAFITEKTDVIVATVAFGMGIDKSNVRYVIHAAMPKSLENYQQESGRAGRDGLEAECCLFFSSGDFGLWKRMLSDLNGDAYEAALQSLNGMSAYCTAVCCRHRSLVQHFGDSYDKDSCNACDVCLGDLDLVDDALVIGQKILSCVVRLGQRFGGDYTSLVLAGSQEKRILEQRHDELSTWGLLKDENRRNVRDWIEQLVGQKFLEKAGEYNVLQVTPEGRRLLRGDVTPRLLKPKATAKKSSRKSAGGVSANSWEGVDEGLFEHLRTIRREKAAELEVPAYVVFGDAALREMARLRPTTLAAFINVKGVGEKKRDDYGQEFVDEIGRYCRDHELATDLTPADVAPSGASTEPRTPRPLRKSAIVAFSHFEQGKSVAAVAAGMGRAISTVNGYLNDYITHQNITDPTPWVEADVVEKVEAAANEVGTQWLKPIFEAQDGSIDYDRIRIVVSCLRNREKQKLDS